MGWTETVARHYKNGKVDKNKEILEVFADGYEIIKGSFVGSTWYGAVKHNNEIFGCVARTSVRKEGYGHWFGYKLMDETEGPYYFDCPVSILNLLTPTDNEIANEWRNKCRENILKKKKAKSIPVGTILEFDWQGRKRQAQLRVSSYSGKKRWFDTVDVNHYYPTKYVVANGVEV